MSHDYDLRGAAIFANPYPLYQRLRSDHPVHLDTSLGCWVVTSYRDVTLALADRNLSSERSVSTAVFQDQRWKDLAPLFVHISNLMFFADPPKHTRLRSLVSQAFSPRIIETWRSHIQSIVNARLDLVQKKGRMDIIADIALPLPLQVLTDMFGIPANDQPQLKRWSDDLVAFFGNPPTLEVCTQLMHSLQDFMAYFWHIIAQRQHRRDSGLSLSLRSLSTPTSCPLRDTHPQDDLIQLLIEAKDAADALSEDELLVNCAGLFGGGHGSTANLITNGLLTLLRNPAQMQRLREQPQLIASAVEECLRYESPVQFTARKAIQNTEIGNKKIYKGQSVLLMLGAANRDPAQFHDPDRFDIGRQDNHHLAFGHNVHYCVGAMLGRLEAQIAISTVVQRMPGLQLDAQPLEWQENLAFHGVKALPVLF